MIVLKITSSLTCKHQFIIFCSHFY